MSWGTGQRWGLVVVGARVAVGWERWAGQSWPRLLGPWGSHRMVGPDAGARGLPGVTRGGGVEALAGGPGWSSGGGGHAKPLRLGAWRGGMLGVDKGTFPPRRAPSRDSEPRLRSPPRAGPEPGSP
jgi:hypothetical protein